VKVKNDTGKDEIFLTDNYHLHPLLLSVERYSAVGRIL